MKLDCVLTACNNNPLYMGFIPYFIKAWKKLYPNTNIKIVLINNSIPEEYKKYSEYIILFEPNDKICDKLASQVIRILYPAILDYQEAVLITDIDMIPMNSKYYSDSIKQFDSDKFIVYKKIDYKRNEIMICYNAASPKVWSSIFFIKNINDIKNLLIELTDVKTKLEQNKNTKKYSWIIDQRLLFNRIKFWQQNGGIVYELSNFIYPLKRLCRSKFIHLSDKIKEDIKNEFFIDYHCKRSFEEYQEINNEILELLPEKK